MCRSQKWGSKGSTFLLLFNYYNRATIITTVTAVIVII